MFASVQKKAGYFSFVSIAVTRGERRGLPPLNFKYEKKKICPKTECYNADLDILRFVTFARYVFVIKVTPMALMYGRRWVDFFFVAA